MGYTHYWDQSRDFTDAEWKNIKLKATNLLLNPSGDAQDILDTDKKGDPWVISNDIIKFNGKNYDDLSHETFLLEKKKGDVPDWSSDEVKKKGVVFNFCKTAEKPYDKYVTAMLILADNIAPGVLHITSDGWFHEWREGFELAQSVIPGVIMPDHIRLNPDAKKENQKMINKMKMDFDTFTDKVETWI